MQADNVARFELRWHDRRVGGMQTPRRFLDFFINGESLYEKHRADFISCLGWFGQAEDDLAAARLLRDEPPDVDDRVAIYVCPECGDLDCGSITAVIERQGSIIVWAAPAMTTRDHEAGTWHHDEGVFADWPELRFDARQYWSGVTNRPRVQ